MKPMQAAMRESVGDFFQQFAYLDVLVGPGGERPREDWTLCARVRCDGGEDEVVVMLAPAFARAIGEGFTGQPEGSMEEVNDLVLEIANVLAGQAYEIAHGGRKPKDIGPPAWMSFDEAAAAWSRASEDDRHMLALDDGEQGGLLVACKEAWSGQWE